MTEEHQHSQPIFFCGDRLACNECTDINEVHNNQCYHLCHKVGKTICSKCVRFHADQVANK